MSRHLLFAITFLMGLALAIPASAQTVTGSNLLNQREGYARATTGGLNGQIYVVTKKTDYATGTVPQSERDGTLRYGVEGLTGKRWIVFHPSLFTSTLSDGRKGAFIGLQRPLLITNGNITIDGRAGSVGGAGRVAVITRTYNWNNYYVTGNGAGCEAKTNSQGQRIEPFGGLMTIRNANNIIVSHLLFRQYRVGTPTQPVTDELCFGTQMEIFNQYPSGNPANLTAQNSYDKIWINRSQFYDCGHHCIGASFPSPSRIASISVTRNEFLNSYKAMLVGNVGDWQDVAEENNLVWRIRLTVAKNHFNNGGLRMPRYNSTYMHAYNNFYQNWTDSAIDPAQDTRTFVEQNFFSTYLNGGVRDTSIRAVAHPNEQIWVYRNVYYKNANNQDNLYPLIPRNPPKAYYDSAAAPDIIDVSSMNPVSAYTMLAALGSWKAENNDVY